VQLRPIDLIRDHSLYTQAVRNHEEAGAPPPTERSLHGYRLYAPRHGAALQTLLALIPRTVTQLWPPSC
jgi:hypothetical protein